MANGSSAYIDASLHGARGVSARAPEVRLNRAFMERGMSAGHGGGGVRAGFGGGGGGGGRQTPENAFSRNGDPAVTGEFDKNPTGRWMGIPIFGGDLTSAGKEQKSDHDILRQGQALYAQARMQGADDKQAAQHAFAVLGAPLFMAMQSHSSAPLQSSASIHRFLAGGDNTRWVTTGQGQYQVDQDTGEQLNFKPNLGPQQADFVPTSKTPTMGADGKMYQAGVSRSTGQPMMVPYQVGRAQGAPAPAGGGQGVGGTAGPATPVAQTAQNAPAGSVGAPGVNAPGGAFTPGAQASGKETQGERQEARNLGNVMASVQSAKQDLEAQGALGETPLLRGVAAYMPGQGGQSAANYDRSLKAVQAEIGGALAGNSRLKMQYEHMQSLLPSSWNGEAYARGAFNNVMDIARTQIAQMARQFPGDPEINDVAATYNAKPDYWLGQDTPNGHIPGMQEKLQQLKTNGNPASLSPNDIAQIYAFEAFDGGFKPKLNDNQMMALGNEMNNRGLWGIRDQLVRQNPGLASVLPTGVEYNNQFSDAIKQRAQDLGARATQPGKTQALTPNPQGTQTMPPGSSYSPDFRQAEQNERTAAVDQSQQQPLVEVGERAMSGTNNPQANAGIQQPAQEAPANPQADQAVAQQPGGGYQPAATTAPAGQAPGNPAAAVAAPQPTRPNVTGAPNAALPAANYRPLSQADALNYNELQQLRSQGLAPGQATAPVQWAGVSGGGSSAVPGHPLNKAEELRRAAQTNFGGGRDFHNNAGFTGQPDRQGTQEIQANGKPIEAGMTSGVPWSIDPFSFFRGGSSAALPTPRAEAVIRPAPGYVVNGGQENPDEQGASGLGDQPAPAEEGATETPDNSVSGFGQTGEMPVSRQQVIPIPPPQPANASSLYSGSALGAFTSGF